MIEYDWPVVPLCAAQRRDVKEEDVLNGGLFRKCDISDPCNFDTFSQPATKFLGYTPNPVQFVVQLKGCPLDCPYCYVTREGIDGDDAAVTTWSMIEAYRDSGCEVFHLMGGAPATYLVGWRSLANNVAVFHSDFLLMENFYDIDHLRGLPGVFAVSLKDEYLYTAHQKQMMLFNIRTIVWSGINFYVTITGQDSPLSEAILRAVPPSIANDVQRVEIREYKATKEQEYGNNQEHHT